VTKAPTRVRRLAAGSALAGVAFMLATGCDPHGETGAPTERSGQAVSEDPYDYAELVVHSIEPGEPTPEGLAYVRAVADVMAQAEAASAEDRIGLLRKGLALPVPAGLGEAEILRLEMAAALAETLLERPEGAQVAHDLLMPMLKTERSLPLDRASARALVALGDASVKTGRDALAAGSYTRSIRMMSMLRQELVNR